MKRIFYQLLFFLCLPVAMISCAGDEQQEEQVEYQEDEDQDQGQDQQQGDDQDQQQGNDQDQQQGEDQEYQEDDQQGEDQEVVESLENEQAANMSNEQVIGSEQQAAPVIDPNQQPGEQVAVSEGAVEGAVPVAVADGAAQGAAPVAAPQSGARVRYVKSRSESVYSSPDGSSIAGTLEKGDHPLVTSNGEWSMTADGRYIKSSALTDRPVGRHEPAAEWR